MLRSVWKGFLESLYGSTEAYYGTVEQQGRLTLHLHMLLWIKGYVSPQHLRDLVMEPSSAFQQNLVKYLEACHQGELSLGTVGQFKKLQDEKELQDDYKKPTETLPIPPSYCCIDCATRKCECDQCIAYENRNSSFHEITDDILLRSNVHVCSGSQVKSNNVGTNTQTNLGCKSNHHIDHKFIVLSLSHQIL